MAKRTTYQVSEVAQLTGVSVRALHHYDEIGLLVPSGRSEASYRRYDGDDLLRLQQILIGRELGMPLEEIKRSLDDPGFDRRAALARQRRELEKRLDRTSAMLRAVDAALATLGDNDKSGEIPMHDSKSESKHDENAALFEGFDPARYEQETRERWGETDAYRESARRTANYSKADWQQYQAEADEILQAAAELFRAGQAADSEAARAVAERHRLSIDRFFYPCSPRQHAALANLYEADARFAANIDQQAAGLTPWLAAAIRANAGT